jgi:hypothetical protein
MNRLLRLGRGAVAAGLLLACVSFADDASKTKEAAPKDVSGVWELKILIPGGRPPQESTLTIQNDGGKYVGFLTGKQNRLSSQGRPTPVKDLEYKDGKLSFKMLFERGGQKAEIHYDADVSGETLKGAMSIVGRPIKISLEGKRESPVEGLWKITMAIESGEKFAPTIQIKGSGKTFTGEYIGIRGKKSTIKDVKFENGEISFDAPDRGDEDLVFHYAGKLSGDSVKGTVSWNAAGNQKRSMKFEAAKSRAQTADVAGTWKLKVPMKDGPTLEPTLTLTQSGATVQGTYKGENGETKITDGMVLGEEFSFDVTRQKDGKVFKLHYQGKVNGDSLKGSVDYNFEGIAGAIDYEGTRVAGGTAAKP